MLTLSEQGQEILERLWMAEEDGQRGLPVNALPRSDVRELVTLGMVVEDAVYWTLTDAGRPEAAQAIRRHRLGERLLADVLKTQDERLDEHACRLEHVLFDGLDESVCTLLGHPQFCPHGKPIPQGACCREMRATLARVVAPLDELEPGERGHVAYLRMTDAARLQKLMAMGVLPGATIALLRRSPSFVFECGYSQFAVDRDIAGEIYVRLSPRQ